MATVVQTEKRLAVVASWSLFGAFGLCLILSGFGSRQLAASLSGFALFVAGFIAHVIINRVYRTSFSSGEVVLGFVAFGVAVLSFVVSWITASHFGQSNVVAGIAGFAALVVAFLVYVVTKYGLKGSFSMFHQPRHE